MNDILEQLNEVQTEEQKASLKKMVEQKGFSVFNQLVYGYHDELKKMDESRFELMNRWLELGKELFPKPETISPAWENIWEDLLSIFKQKQEFFGQVPLAERVGEWQVLIDNQFSTDTTVCHTEKSFTEATYLAAKYLTTLKKAEVLKLQKIITSITIHGK